MIFSGRCSVFGYPNDPGMAQDDGLAFYEPEEANLHPWIFTPPPVANPLIATWTRLRQNFPYLALNVDQSLPREIWRYIPWKVTNPANGLFLVAWLVDRGPGASGRVADLAPWIAYRLRLAGEGMDPNDIADMDVTVENLSPLPFIPPPKLTAS